MSRVALSQIPITDEVAATGEIAATYAEIQRVMEIPFVPNIFKTLASSPAALTGRHESARRLKRSTADRHPRRSTGGRLHGR